MESNDRGIDLEDSLPEGAAGKAQPEKLFHLIINPAPFRPNSQGNPAIPIVNNIPQVPITFWVSNDEATEIIDQGRQEIFNKRLELVMEGNCWQPGVHRLFQAV